MSGEWGVIQFEHIERPRQPDVIVQHEPISRKNAAIVAGAKGTHDTTKKIIENSLAARQKLA
jgi:hypothetical protein